MGKTTRPFKNKKYKTNTKKLNGQKLGSLSFFQRSDLCYT